MSTGNKPAALTPVRAAALDDVDELNQLIAFAYRGGKTAVPWTNEHKLVKGPRITPDALRDIITDSGKTILVAYSERGGKIVLTGCVLVENHGDGHGHIGMLAVDPELQSAGIGKVLLQSAEKHAIEVFRCHTATMWILSGRDELLSWYKRMGYEETGETEPFPGPESGNVPLVENLHFLVIGKKLVS